MKESVKVRKPPRDLTGEVISLGRLPIPGVRWTKNRKYMVVQAVRFELVSLEEIKRWYHMADEEFQSWLRQFGFLK